MTFNTERNRGKNTFYLLSTILTLIIITSTLMLPTKSMVETEEESPFKMVAEITVEKPSGSKVSICKDDDIILKNFAQLIGELFSIDFNSSIRGVSGSTGTWEDGLGTSSEDGIEIDYDESFIHIGDGTTSPTIDDYSLDNENTTVKVSAHTYSTSGVEYNVSISCVWNPTKTYTIKEMGLSVESTSLGGEQVMIARDTVTPIDVENGDTVTLKYIWLFNEGA